MQEFDYVRVQSVQEAVALLAGEENRARILCGGTDLLVQLREGQRQARLLVDIKTIPELNQLHYDPVNGLTLGAAVSCLRLCQDETARQLYPGLVEAASLIGSVQIQGRASVGGNVCNASPAADSIPALIVHRAVCRLVGPGGERQAAIEQFCCAPGKTILQRGEILVSLHLPPPPPGFGAGYLRFTPRNEMDIAVVGAGAAVILAEDQQTIRWARLALGAVAPTPLWVEAAGDFLAGRAADAENVQQAARLARQAARPIRDVRGEAAQRSQLVEVLARRALETAIQRARAAVH